MENTNANDIDTPQPIQNNEFKVQIDMKYTNDASNKYIEIKVSSNVKKKEYNQMLKYEDFLQYDNYKLAQNLKNIEEQLKFACQKGNFNITKIGEKLQLTFNTKFGICNIILYEVGEEAKPPVYEKPKDEVNKNMKFNQNDYENKILQLQKEHKLEIEKIEKNYNNAINEMKSEFSNVLSSVERQFKKEMNDFITKVEKKLSSNVIPMNFNNNNVNNLNNNNNKNIKIDPNANQMITTLYQEVQQIKKTLSFLDAIPTKSEFNLLKSWINPNKNINFELLYSIEKNGDDALNFHSICDNEKNTLTIVQLEDRKIGGYTTLDWSGDGESKTDKDTFIFDLTNKKKYPKINNKRSIFCLENRGPCFGQACDLGIFNPMNKGWSNKNGSFIVNQEISGGKENFAIKELEIYKVIFLD
jgi:hypothetical protein